MAVVNGYATIAEVRDQLADASAQLDLELLEKAVNASSRAIDRYCGRRFWLDASVTTRTYLVCDPCTVFVDDIGTRTGVIVKTGTDGVTFPTTLASTDFILEPRNADVVAGGDTADAFAFWQVSSLVGAPWYVHPHRPTLSVTARFGWSAVPPDVNEACILKATSLFKRKDAPFGVAGFGEFGAVRITRRDPDVVDLLNPFMLPGFA